MNRRNFTKNLGLTGAGLIVAPQTLLHAHPVKEDVIIWPWLLRLVATSVISEVAKRAVEYVADKITGVDDNSTPTVVHNQQTNYQSVYHYNEQKPDVMIPTAAASPGPVDFYGRDENHHRHAAKLNAPSFAGMTSAVQELAYQDGQAVDRLRDTMLPRLIGGYAGGSGRNIPVQSCRYETRHATILVTYHLDIAARSQYYTTVEVLPYREMFHTRDCRYKKREFVYNELLLLS